MIENIRWTLAIAACTFCLCGAPPQAEAEKQLEAAIQKETVQGDLKAAIALYGKVLERHARNRPVAAQALFRLGECQEKLGQAEARRAFERLVREFGDQGELVARAKTKLGTPLPAGGKLNVTRVEPSAPGCVVEDVSSKVELCLKNGDLVVRDVQSGLERKLVAKPSAAARLVVGGVSPDKRTVVYFSIADDKPELRAIQIDGTRDRLLARTPPGRWAAPLYRAWSADGQRLLAVVSSPGRDEGALGIITVASGEFQTLRSIKGRGAAAFSPDGKFVAFEESGAAPTDPISLSIMPVSGGDPVALNGPNSLVGWHSSGSLLYTSDQNGGSLDVWSIPIRNGKPEDLPKNLYSNVQPRWWIWLDRAGAIRLDKFGGRNEIRTASLLAEGGVAAPRIATKRFQGGTWSPEYSPDGRSLLYATAFAPGTVKFVVQDLSSGDEKVHEVPLRSIGNVVWYPDGKALAVEAMRQRGEEWALYRFVPGSGEISLIAPAERPQFSRDGRYLYTMPRPAGRSTGAAVVRMDLRSGESREVYRPAAGERVWVFSVSPDGTQLALSLGPSRTTGAVTQSRIAIAPVGGGEARTLVDFDSPTPGRVAWTHDGRSILYGNGSGQGRYDLRIVPASGGESRKLLSTSQILTIVTHPNGRDITMALREDNTEYWMVENAIGVSRR